MSLEEIENPLSVILSANGLMGVNVNVVLISFPSTFSRTSRGAHTERWIVGSDIECNRGDVLPSAQMKRDGRVLILPSDILRRLRQKALRCNRAISEEAGSARQRVAILVGVAICPMLPVVGIGMIVVVECAPLRSSVAVVHVVASYSNKTSRRRS